MLDFTANHPQRCPLTWKRAATLRRYAARTYFLQSVSSDALFLRRLYTAIVAATHKALGMVAEDCVLDELSAVDVHDAVYVSVEAAVNQVGLPPDYETKEHLDVSKTAIACRAPAAV